jgi:hypothetical protein
MFFSIIPYELNISKFLEIWKSAQNLDISLGFLVGRIETRAESYLPAQNYKKYLTSVQIFRFKKMLTIIWDVVKWNDYEWYFYKYIWLDELKSKWDSFLTFMKELVVTNCWTFTEEFSELKFLLIVSSLGLNPTNKNLTSENFSVKMRKLLPTKIFT